MNKKCMNSGVKMSGILLLIMWGSRQIGLYGNTPPSSERSTSLTRENLKIKTTKKPCGSVATLIALNIGCFIQGQLSDTSWKRTGTQEAGAWTGVGQPRPSQWAKTSLIGNNFGQNWGTPLGSPLKHQPFRVKFLWRRFFLGGLQDSTTQPSLCSPAFPHLWMEPQCKPFVLEEFNLSLNAWWWHLCNVKSMSDLLVLVIGETSWLLRVWLAVSRGEAQGYQLASRMGLCLSM